ncbi:SH3 domain-containing protein Dlish-like [Oscarella lobularis]|uniref:SH3 domain-containing protein Dlish-like n=1 Tax=Oscarella lobularis TaxID=121494 RepID=UPI00331383D3
MSFSFFCPTRFGRRRRKQQQQQQQQQRAYQDPAFVDEPYEVSGNTQHFPPGCYNVILQTFEATMADELVVNEGDIVQMLYRENDWAYVANLDGDEGYVPYSFCAEQAPRSSSLPSRSSATSSAGAVHENGGGASVGGDASKPPATARSPSDTKTASYALNARPSPGRKPTPSTTPEDSIERLDPARLLHDRMGDAGSPPLTDDDDDDDDDSVRLPSASRASATATNKVNDRKDGRQRVNGAAFPRGAQEQHTTYTEVHVGFGGSTSTPTDSTTSTTSGGESRFVKKAIGTFLVLYDFTECRDDEVPVKRADIVTLLNDDDPDWAWVAKSDQGEGFVPRNFLVPINQTAKPPALQETTSNRRVPHDANGGQSRLVVLYDFHAQSVSQLTVCRGDSVFVDAATRDTREPWLWVYSPQANRSGFIPANFVRPPVGL